MVPKTWAHLPFFRRDWPRISQALRSEMRLVLPPDPLRFAALTLTPPDKASVVILGQDPYPTPGHAMGLSFSVTAETHPLPRSLSNIFKEMSNDLGACPATGDLTFWAQQGVVLLNTSLSVPAGLAGGHGGLGWHRLAEDVLVEVSQQPTAFVLWGAKAQALRGAIRPGAHLVIETAHPSPLSARRGFFGSRPFSRINTWLAVQGRDPIDWIGPAPLSNRAGLR